MFIFDFDVNVIVDGVIDLVQWVKVFLVEGIDEMVGCIIVDFLVNICFFILECEVYDQVKMVGDVQID